MYILDTDHLSMMDRDTVEAFNLGRRLASVPITDVFTTIVTYEEQMRGWMEYIAHAKSVDQQVEAYKRLRRHDRKQRHSSHAKHCRF